MNDRIKELAERAGFEFWGDEAWRPPGQLIDWSSVYDNELIKFAELVIAECTQQVTGNTSAEQIYGGNYHAEKIKNHFEVRDETLDGKEDIVLNLDQEELYQLMLYAHEQDITLNQLVENILRAYIEEYNKYLTSKGEENE
jgi:hypothetical protein